MSGAITEYLGSGTTAGRPASLSLSTNAIGLYWSTDDTELSMWDGSAWLEDITAGTAFTGGALSSALNEAKGADIASATTTDIGAATGNFVHVTGTTTITGLGTVQAGTRRIVRFAGALLLTHNATSLILPTGANITTAANDVAVFVSEGSGNWRCVGYQRATGAALVSSAPVSSVNGATGVVVLDGGDIGITDTGGYFTATDVEGALQELGAGGGGGSPSESIVASEALAAGNIVNVWNDAGTPKVRKADATAVGKEAQGFVLSAVASGATAAVYFSGKNTAVTGLSPGATLYLGTTPGAVTATAPGAVGNVWQVIGEAYSGTGLNFQKQLPILIKEPAP